MTRGPNQLKARQQITTSTNVQLCDRRQWTKSTLGLLTGLGAFSMLPSSVSVAGESKASVGSGPIEGDFSKLRYCFNTATLRGQKLPIVQLIDLVAAAGYQGIEVWIDELDRHVADGGTLAELKTRCEDRGLRVESAIAFANWLAVDDDQAKSELEKAKRDMEKVAAVGGTCIAAPPAGQNDTPITDWDLAARRLAELAAVGQSVGVEPQLEVWGFSKSIGNLSQAMHLASMTPSTDFGILLDVYHLYKGGSAFEGLRTVSGRSMRLFHMNDYPAQPDRATINDGHRVFPGDGVAPMDDVLRMLVESGFEGALSLELFNQDYYAKDAKWVVETGLAKMKSAVESASKRNQR